MAKFGETNDPVKCSFCGKSQQHVGRMIAGPGVYICNECIGLCNDIIEEEGIVIHEGDFHPSPKDAPLFEVDVAVLEARRRLTDRLGRRPTVAELAAELGLDEEKITSILPRASPRPSGAGGEAQRSDVAELTPLPIAFRMIQHQLSELLQRVDDLAQRVEREDDP